MNLGKQRLATLAASVVGIIAVFLPWANIGVFGYSLASVNGFGGASSMYGWSAGIGWITLIGFLVPAACCVLGITGKIKLASLVGGGVAFIILLFRVIAISGAPGYSTAVGLWLCLIAAIAVVAVPFVKALDE